MCPYELAMTRNDAAARDLYQSQGPEWLMERAPAAYTEALLATILRHIHGTRILDVCCGYGRLALPLLQRGFQVTGIDITAGLLEKGRELLRAAGIPREPFVLGNMKHLPLGDERFDFAFCVWASFNFMTTEFEQQQALREMHRVLKRGGRALIECPLHEDAGPVQTVQVGRVVYDYYPLTVAEMRSLGTGSPFEGSDVFVEVVAERRRMVAVLRK